MTEKNFKRKYEKKFRERGCVIVQNVAGAGVPIGFPDATVISPTGKTYYIEWKKSKNAKHQPLQDYWVEKLTQMGHKAWFVYPENIKEIENEIV